MHTGWRTLLLIAGAAAGLIGGPPPTPWPLRSGPVQDTWRAPSGLVVHAEGRCAPRGDPRAVAWLTLDGTGVPLPAEPPARDWVVLLDRSGSMATEGRFARARAALVERVGTLPPGHRLGLVVYGDRAHTVLPLQTRWTGEDVGRALDRVFVGGASNLDQGLRGALRALKDATPGATTLVVLTDGPPNAGPSPSPSLGERIRDMGTELVVLGLSDQVPGRLWTDLGAAAPRDLTDPLPLSDRLRGADAWAGAALTADLRVSLRFEGPGATGPWLGPTTLGPVRPGQRLHQALQAGSSPLDAAPPGADRVGVAVHAAGEAPVEPQLTVAWAPSPGDRTDPSCLPTPLGTEEAP